MKGSSDKQTPLSAGSLYKIATVALARYRQTQEARSSICGSHMSAGMQVLRLSFTAVSGALEGSWIERGTARIQTSTHTYHTTTPAVTF